MSKLPLLDTEKAGVFYLPAGHAAVLRQQAESAHCVILSAVLGQAQDFQDALEKLGTAFEFPDWYGANFDALYDCLCDQECLAQAQLVLFIHDIRALGEESCDVLIAVLQAAADEWREQGRALWALFLTPGLDLDALPVPKA